MGPTIAESSSAHGPLPEREGLPGPAGMQDTDVSCEAAADSSTAKHCEVLRGSPHGLQACERPALLASRWCADCMMVRVANIGRLCARQDRFACRLGRMITQLQRAWRRWKHSSTSSGADGCVGNLADVTLVPIDDSHDEL
eukprot:gnl/TRDRNA2_/TRDRNA2_221278_c0_seq1.p1 gnl/TRDRNA2_/TRDRNA2_221278_c0~~gnl/TRDRNA2_/TRDRNA2_221278_c0_seq1.p1  ORF type:complete len:148 (-),score=14.87 gnl/TRDRNA2_/TRDRNA2_221278_c0_seq1:80-502(-)